MGSTISDKIFVYVTSRKTWNKISAVSVTVYIQILFMNKQTNFSYENSKFLVKQFSTFNIAHLSKFVVNFNLIILSKFTCTVILMGLFCSVVASGASHFFLFSVNDFGRS